MFDFYFAGTQCKEADDLIVKLNANRLLSYLNDKKTILDYFNNKRSGWKGKLMIDSGAFTAHRKDIELDLDKYCDWINKNHMWFDFCIQLDHIPGKWGEIKTAEQLAKAPEESWKNYLYMLDKVNCPEKILPVFHQGEHFKYLTQMVEHKINGKYIDYICISGNKELTPQQREDWYQLMYSVVHNSKNPNVHIHCLGSATISNAEMFPFTSMDATTWIMVGANGGIMTPRGIVYVSDRCLTDKSHINNMPKEAIDYVKNYCDTIDVLLEDCILDYKARAIANVNYLFTMSRTCKYVGSKNIKSRRLF